MDNSEFIPVKAFFWPYEDNIDNIAKMREAYKAKCNKLHTKMSENYHLCDAILASIQKNNPYRGTPISIKFPLAESKYSLDEFLYWCFGDLEWLDNKVVTTEISNSVCSGERPIKTMRRDNSGYVVLHFFIPQKTLCEPGFLQEVKKRLASRVGETQDSKFAKGRAAEAFPLPPPHTTNNNITNKPVYSKQAYPKLELSKIQTTNKTVPVISSNVMLPTTVVSPPKVIYKKQNALVQPKIVPVPIVRQSVQYKFPKIVQRSIPPLYPRVVPRTVPVNMVVKQPVQYVMSAPQQVNYPQNQYLNPNTNNTVSQFISQKNYSDIQQHFENNPSYPPKQPAGKYVAEIYDGYYMRSSQPIYKTRDGHFITNDNATYSFVPTKFGEIAIQ